MPSSLAVNRSSTSGSSPWPPVSVYGTGACSLDAQGVFSGARLRRLRSPEGSRYLPDRAPRGALPPSAAESVPRRGCHTSVPPCCSCSQRGNVRPLAIGIGLRLSLRARLTPVRLALTGNPWPIGAPVSRRRYRYSCLHLPFPALQPASRRAFNARGMLPYRPRPPWRPKAQGLGGALDARSLSMHGRSTSELLRTL